MKPCANPNCSRQISEQSGIAYCSRCQEAYALFQERNPVLDYFQPKDVQFIFLHPQGCRLKDLANLLGRFELRHLVRAGRITIDRKEKIDGHYYHFVSHKEMVRVINQDHNWISIHQVAIDRGKDYYTLRRYCDRGHFGPVRKNLANEFAISVTALIHFDLRWAKAVKALKESQGKANKRKSAVLVRPWIQAKKPLTEQNRIKKYACPTCHFAFFTRDGKIVAESFVPADIKFIAKHLNGCTAKELGDHLGINRSVIDKYIRTGNIRIFKSERTGKQVERYIDRNEMVDVISRAHNWVSLYQLAWDFGKKYQTVLDYSSEADFGRIRKNLQNRRAVLRCYAARFEEIYETIAKGREEHRNNRVHLLDDGEIHLAKLADLCDQPYSRVQHFLDDIPHYAKNGFSVITVDDLKAFILKVAAKQVRHNFELVAACLGKPPISEDAVFLKKVEWHRLRSTNKKGGIYSSLQEGEYTMGQVAEMAGADTSTAQGWFRKFFKTSKRGILKTTTTAEIKRFILSVLRQDYKARPRWAENILKSNLWPILSKDQDFMRQVEEARQLQS